MESSPAPPFFALFVPFVAFHDLFRSSVSILSFACVVDLPFFFYLPTSPSLPSLSLPLASPFSYLSLSYLPPLFTLGSLVAA